MEDHALQDDGWCRCGGWHTDARPGSWERQHRFEHHQLRHLLEELPQLLRRVEEPAATAATHPELVCTCDYKPYPHSRFPAHPSVRRVTPDGRHGFDLDEDQLEQLVQHVENVDRISEPEN